MKARFPKLLLLALMMGATVLLWSPLKSHSQSKTFAPTMEWRPTQAAADAKYLGNQSCTECHTQGDTQHSSPMGKALEPVADCQILRDHPRLTFQSGIYKFSIVRQGQQSLYTVTDGKETIAVPILYAFGQGKAGQTYVLEYQGRYYESRVSFYNELKGLDYTLGAPPKPAGSLIEAFGRAMDSLDTKDCFSCHATAAVSDGKLQLSKLTPGITCEGCHGAGDKHVALMRDKTAKKAGDKAIFNPGRFDTEGVTQFCGSCHRTWAQVQLMKVQGVLNVRFQPYRIFGSKCYDFDDKRISCTACHNPHDAMTQPMTHYEAKCAACHSNTKATGQGKVYAPCKTGKTTNCVACHMPQYDLPGSHHKFTDHQIRIVRTGEAYPN